jgi:hypothetical protein
MLALQHQTRALRVVVEQLGIALLIAVASDVSGFFSRTAQIGGALVSAVLLVFVLYEQLRHRRNTHEQHWFSARALAESMKTLTWRYVMHLAQFESDGSADEAFRHVTTQIGESGHGLKGFHYQDSSVDEIITPRMRELRMLPWKERWDLYLRGRLEDQVRWYDRKARQNAHRATQFARAALATLAVGVGMALLRVIVPEINLVGSLTTIAASVVAWSQTRRYDELAASYAAAHGELRQIHAQGQQVTTEQEFARVVADGEGAISREHTMWVAKSTITTPERSGTT